jgi:Mn2+/Fe2+ NRAMP family transporter
MLTMRKDVMGAHVNGRLTTIAGVALAALITSLNLFLIYKQIF